MSGDTADNENGKSIGLCENESQKGRVFCESEMRARARDKQAKKVREIRGKHLAFHGDFAYPLMVATTNKTHLHTRTRTWREKGKIL